MSMASDDSVHFPLEHACSLPVDCTINAIWEPSDNNNILSISENSIYYFDCNTSEPKVNYAHATYANKRYFSLHMIFCSIAKAYWKCKSGSEKPIKTNQLQMESSSE
jgi:hypothetical protein